MKHGRPSKQFSEHNGMAWRIWLPGERGWRREHAARVWQAIGCLAMVADAWNRGAVYYLDSGMGREWVTP